MARSVTLTVNAPEHLHRDLWRALYDYVAEDDRLAEVVLDAVPSNPGIYRIRTRWDGAAGLEHAGYIGEDGTPIRTLPVQKAA